MLSLAKFIKKEIELRENLIGTGFLEPPQNAVRRFANKLRDKQEDEMEHRVTVLGEIVKACGFAAPNTYVMFEVMLPEEGWIFEDVNEYEMYGITRDETVEYNKRKSVTHTSQGMVEAQQDTENEDTTMFTSHFCFPFDYQFKAKDQATKQRPMLLMQVNSVDEWNRHRIEGYGFVKFPEQPGYHTITVDTWRPRASLDSEIHSFFLGGSVRIQKLEELVRTRFIDSNGYADIVNRFGVETEDAGSVTVNLNVSSQDIKTRRARRQIAQVTKEKEKLETRKLVMKYTLELKKETEHAPKAFDHDPAPEREANEDRTTFHRGEGQWTGGQAQFQY